MPSMQEIRQKYPQYDDMSDAQLSDALYSKFYSDMPREEFDAKIGMTAPETQPSEGRNPSSEADDTLSMARTGLGGFIEGIPIAGPLLRRGTEMAAAATLAPMSDLTYDEILAKIDEQNASEKRDNPVIDIGSQVAGSIAATAPLAATATGAKALGLTGKSLMGRVGASAASGAAIAGADQTARDFADDGTVDPMNTAGATAVGAGFGAAIPVAGAGARKLGGSLYDKARKGWDAAFNPKRRAARQISDAIDIDKAAGRSALSADDLARAQRNGQPLLNADHGGETTRALTRAATNQSPEARDTIARAVNERFETQSDRLVSKITDLAGGKVDDLAAVEQLRRAATKANDPAYKKAFTHPKAQSLFTPRLQELMQAPAMRAAARSVPKKSANRGAVQGFKEIRNPFEMNSNGDYVLRKTADGTAIAPNLQFWNQVKINLDGAYSSTRDRSMRADIKALKDALVDELDSAVPQYAVARAGAARFFAAEDAVEAGRKFFKSARMMPEFRKGLMAMKGAEREAFKVGFASEIIDAAKSSPDRSNVISRYFKSPDSREKMVMAFGRPAAQEFEAFVRIENAMDMLRTAATGNSTTARQLLESGAVGFGTWWYTGDLTTGVVAGAGARMAGRKIHANIMKQTADMLMSNDPQVLQRAIKMASKSQQHMAAVDAITKAIGGAARGVGFQLSTE